jgi:hypothetical protein
LGQLEEMLHVEFCPVYDWYEGVNNPHKWPPSSALQ